MVLCCIDLYVGGGMDWIVDLMYVFLLSKIGGSCDVDDELLLIEL